MPKNNQLVKGGVMTQALGPVTPTQIFLSYGLELLYTILNVNPKLQPGK